MEQGWIGFDLDGTLAIYTGWQGFEHIGAPVPAMVDKVKELLKAGQRVKIFTARVCSKQTEDEQVLARTTIEKWCLDHIGQKLEVTAEKDFHMIEMYDDRCVSVEFNTGRITTEVET